MNAKLTRASKQAQVLEALKDLERSASILCNFDQQKYYFRKQGDWSRCCESIRNARAVIAAQEGKP